MQTIYVQFSDESESTVASYFAGPQDPEDHPHQGELAASEPRWASFYNEMPAIMKGSLPAPTA